MKIATPPGTSIWSLLWNGIRTGKLGSILHIIFLSRHILAATQGRPCLIHTVPSMFWAPSTILPSNMKMIGAVCPNAGDDGSSKPLPGDLEEFIAGSSKPVVLMTLGSMVATMDPKQVAKVIAGLEDSRWKAIAVVRDCILEKLPEEVKSSKDILFAGWIPQAELIARPEIAAVITHCGWGATLETVQAGKPAVCLPSFGDQPGNAKILVSKGMAITLDIEAFTAKQLNDALADVLFMSSYREAAEKVPAPFITIHLRHCAATYSELMVAD